MKDNLTLIPRQMDGPSNLLLILAVQIVGLMFASFFVLTYFADLKSKTIEDAKQNASVISALQNLSMAELEIVAERMKADHTVKDVFFFDATGRSFNSNNRRFLPLSELPNLNGDPQIVDISDTKKIGFHDQSAPTRYSDYIVGAMTATEGQTKATGYVLIQVNYRPLFQTTLWQICFVAALALILVIISFTTYFWLNRRWARPLGALNKTIELAYRDGNEPFAVNKFANEINKNCGYAMGKQDEFSELIRQVCLLAQHIECRDTELENFRIELENKVVDRTNKLVKAKDEAEAANRAKSTFLAQMSHELRTPLNGVLGMAQALQRADLKPIERNQLDVILSSGELLLAVLSDILDLSKIEANKLELNAVKSEILSTLERTYHLWRPTAEEKGISLTFDDKDLKIDKAIFDEFRVQQCVSNIVSNALKFTKEGEVAIKVSSEETSTQDRTHKVSVAIQDTGIGMDQNTINKLFQPFAQADASTSSIYGGTGLGLVISQKFAQLMEGDLTVISTPNVGSCFTLTFIVRVVDYHSSLSVGNNVDITDGRTYDTDFSGKRLLLVDDNAVNLAVARVFIDAMGFDTTEAENGKDALELAQNHKFDLILLDIHMPIMNGPETYKKLRISGGLSHNTPVIALTANAMDGDREIYTKRYGMQGYISKPIKSQELEEEIRHVLSKTPTQPAPKNLTQPIGQPAH